MRQVRFNYADVPPISLTGKRKVQQWVSTIFQEEGRELALVEYIFCTDEYLLSINKQFLQHDYYTDIITFDLTEKKGSSTIGEIYISIDRVKENAVDHKVSFQTELLRVIAHGALHLCGFGDKTKSEITIMRTKEDEYLRIFGT
jgi:probable rRNA maturation factor